MEELINFNKILKCYKYRIDGVYDASLKDSDVQYNYILHKCRFIDFDIKEFYSYKDDTYYYLIRRSYFDKIKNNFK